MDWLIGNIDSPALIEAAIQLKPTGCDLLTFSSWRTLGRLAGLTESLSTTDAHSMQMHLRFTRQNAIQIKHTPISERPPLWVLWILCRGRFTVHYRYISTTTRLAEGTAVHECKVHRSTA